MGFTPAEQAAIDDHAASLGMTSAEYIRQTAVERALSWQRERETFREMARRRGVTIEDLLRRGCLTDDRP